MKSHFGDKCTALWFLTPHTLIITLISSRNTFHGTTCSGAQTLLWILRHSEDLIQMRPSLLAAHDCSSIQFCYWWPWQLFVLFYPTHEAATTISSQFNILFPPVPLLSLSLLLLFPALGLCQQQLRFSWRCAQQLTQDLAFHSLL